MKRMLGALIAVVLGATAFAGPFIGVELVPIGTPTKSHGPASHGPAANASFVVGWDSGNWIKTAFSFSDPFYLDGSYGISFSPLWNLTPSWRIGGAAVFGFEVEKLQLKSACWSVGVETVAKWRGVMGWLRLTFPMKVYSNKPFGGALITVGLGFDFLPCCIGEVPGCPDDLLGGGCP